MTLTYGYARTIADVAPSSRLGGALTSAGSSNAYTLTSGESLAAYDDGMRFAWVPNADSTGAATLNLDGIGAKKILLSDGVTQAGAGDVRTGIVCDIVYLTALDSGNGAWQMTGRYTGDVIDNFEMGLWRQARLSTALATEFTPGELVDGERAWCAGREAVDDGAQGWWQWDASDLSSILV